MTIRNKTAALGALGSAALNAGTHVAEGMAGGHLGGNILGKAVHRGSNLSEVLSHMGLSHALSDQVVNPGSMRAAKLILGPEATFAYEQAHNLGSMLSNMSPQMRDAAIHAAAQGAPHVAGIPVAGDLAKAFQHEAFGTTPQFTTNPEHPMSAAASKLYGGALRGMMSNVNSPFDTRAQRLLKNTIGVTNAVAPAAVPGLTASVLGHYAVNAGREAVGNSSIGVNSAKKLLAQGLSGKQYHPAVEALSDYVLSPMALDPYRAGAAVRQAVPENLRHMITPEAAQTGIQAGEDIVRAGQAINEALKSGRKVAPHLQSLGEEALRQYGPQLQEALKDVGQQGLRNAGTAAARHIEQMAPGAIDQVAEAINQAARRSQRSAAPTPAQPTAPVVTPAPAPAAPQAAPAAPAATAAQMPVPVQENTALAPSNWRRYAVPGAIGAGILGAGGMYLMDQGQEQDADNVRTASIRYNIDAALAEL